MERDGVDMGRNGGASKLYSATQQLNAPRAAQGHWEKITTLLFLTDTLEQGGVCVYMYARPTFKLNGQPQPPNCRLPSGTTDIENSFPKIEKLKTHPLTPAILENIFEKCLVTWGWGWPL